MQLLYKAYACEELEGGKFLLPGYPAALGTTRVKPGDKIEVVLADGTRLQTTAINTKIYTLTEALMLKLNVRANADFYLAIQVPDDFSPVAVILGVEVFLDDSTTS